MSMLHVIYDLGNKNRLYKSRKVIYDLSM